MRGGQPFSTREYLLLPQELATLLRGQLGAVNSINASAYGKFWVKLMVDRAAATGRKNVFETAWEAFLVSVKPSMKGLDGVRGATLARFWAGTEEALNESRAVSRQ